MPLARTVRVDAHAPQRPLAQGLDALVRAKLPPALHALLLALLASLLARPRASLAGRFWHPSPDITETTEAPQADNLRVDRYWRAFIGYVLNGRRNRGMAPHGEAVPASPACIARAPP